MADLKFFKGIHRFLPTLIKMEGFTVTEIPVRHNPRTAGKSHYGVWNRLFASFYDLLAVEWDEKRMFRYEVAERVNSAPRNGAAVSPTFIASLWSLFVQARCMRQRFCPASGHERIKRNQRDQFRDLRTPGRRAVERSAISLGRALEIQTFRFGPTSRAACFSADGSFVLIRIRLIPDSCLRGTVSANWRAVYGRI